MARFLIRDIKYKKGRRVGKYTAVYARTRMEALRKFAERKHGKGKWEFEHKPLPKGYVRKQYLKRRRKRHKRRKRAKRSDPLSAVKW